MTTFKRLPTTVLVPLACEGWTTICIEYCPRSVVPNVEAEHASLVRLISEAQRHTIDMAEVLNDELEKAKMHDGLSTDLKFHTHYATEKKVLISDSYVKIDVIVVIPRLKVKIKYLMGFVECILEGFMGETWKVLDPDGYYEVIKEEYAAAHALAMAETGDDGGTAIAEEAGEENGDVYTPPGPAGPLHQRFMPAGYGYDEQGSN